MSKSQAQQSQKRRQARTERRRVEAKGRKTQERARISIQSSPLLGPGNPAPPAPPVFQQEDLSIVRAQLKALLKGEGDADMKVRSWSPSPDGGSPAEIVVDLKLLGLALVAKGTIVPITLDSFFDQDNAPIPTPGTNEDWDWRQATPGRLILDMLIHDKDAAAALVASKAIGEIIDRLSCVRTVGDNLHARLGITERDEDTLDHLARRLPDDERRFWFRVQRDGLFMENFGDTLYGAIEVGFSGPLIDFFESTDEALIERLPGRYNPRSRHANPLNWRLVGKGPWKHDEMLTQLRRKHEATRLWSATQMIHRAQGPDSQVVVYWRAEELEIVAVALDEGPIFYVNGENIRSTLEQGERLATEKLRSWFSEPQIDALLHVFETFEEERERDRTGMDADDF